MKTVQHAHEGRRAARRAAIAGEGGFLLVLVMVIMLIVSAIAASTLINSFLERSLAKNLNYASVALQAAEAGISVGQAWIHENMNFIYNPMADADFYTNATKYNWSHTINGTLDRDINGDGDLDDAGERGGSYTVTMRFKREWLDKNGDGFCTGPGEVSQYSDYDDPFPGPADACPDWAGPPSPGAGEIVIYNKLGSASAPIDKCFGFPPSRAVGNVAGKEGYPVIEITSDATFGNASYRQVLLDVARNLVSIPGAKGAITAAGGVNFGNSESQIKDGRNHRLDGTLGYTNPVCAGPLGNQQPDIFVEAGKPTDIGKVETCVNDGAATVNAGPAMTDIYTPWGAMGYNTEAEMMADPQVLTFPAGSDHALVAAAVQPGIIVYYQGVDDFRPGSKTGVLVSKGRFEQHGGDKFTGLVVAQGVNLVGTTTMIGAIVTWDPAAAAAYGNGTMDILYSCDALVQGMGNAGWESRLSWNRVR